MTKCRSGIILITLSLSFGGLISWSGLLIFRQYIYPETCLLTDKFNKNFNCYKSVYLSEDNTWYNCGNTQNYITNYDVLVKDIPYTLSGRQIPTCKTICKVNADKELIFNDKVYGKDNNYLSIEPDLEFYNRININETFNCYINGNRDRVFKDDYMISYNKLLMLDMIALGLFIFSLVIIYRKFICIRRNTITDINMDYIPA